jgi:hypothetical protein
MSGWSGRRKAIRRAALFPAGLAVLMGMWGCVAFDQRSRQELETAYGANPPRIDATYAAKYVSPQGVWKVFIKGSDTDGDLQFINVALWFGRGNMTPVRMDIAPDQSRTISGFIALNLWELPERAISSGQLRLLVGLEDRAGHVSERSLLAVGMAMGMPEEPPPAGVFDERHLGNIPVQFIEIQSIGGMGGAAFP